VGTYGCFGEIKNRCCFSYGESLLEAQHNSGSVFRRDLRKRRTQIGLQLMGHHLRHRVMYVPIGKLALWGIGATGGQGAASLGCSRSSHVNFLGNAHRDGGDPRLKRRKWTPLLQVTHDLNERLLHGVFGVTCITADTSSDSVHLGAIAFDQYGVCALLAREARGDKLFITESGHRGQSSGET
jgi:hypothetical protein